MEIKAIETRYNGYRFRSRLEARWAVVFDKMGLQYEYELEGFVLESGECYLPDFYLPELNLYVEIKPTKEIIGLEKVIDFNDQLCGDELSSDTGKRVLLIIGTPTKHEMFTLTGQWCDEHLFGLLDEWNAVEMVPSPMLYGWVLAYRKPPSVRIEDLTRALLAGKQARFEFGEQG